MAGKSKIVRGALENIVNLADFRKEKEMQSSLDEMSENISNRVDDKLKEISEFDWSFEIGDRVITNDEVARSANPIPWEITGKVIQKKGLLPESLPREGKFVYGENIPYYTVQRRVGDSDELEKISLPEWAIAQKFGINKEGALNNLVEE